MPNAADKVQAITDTVNRYMALLSDGDVDGLAGLYADDATVEDPVGGEVHIGSHAIKGFYSAVANVDRSAELVSLRVAGNEAAFHFRLIVAAGDTKMRSVAQAIFTVPRVLRARWPARRRSCPVR